MCWRQAGQGGGGRGVARQSGTGWAAALLVVPNGSWPPGSEAAHGRMGQGTEGSTCPGRPRHAVLLALSAGFCLFEATHGVARQIVSRV